MFDGSLTVFDPENPNRADRFSDSFLLAGLTVGDIVEINLTSNDFDTYLQVVDLDTNTVLAFDDDGDGLDLNARLFFQVASNTSYIVRATSFGAEETGRYTISTSNGNLIPVPIPFIDVDDSVIGSLTTDDFTSPDRVGHFRDDIFLDEALVGDRIQIDLTGDFDTFLEIVDADTGEILASDNDSGVDFNSQLRFTFNPSTSYIFRVSSLDSGVTGHYTLTTTLLDDRPANALLDADPFEFGLTPEFAAIDGTGNNLQDDDLGAAGTALIDLVPTAYSDGASALAGGDRPNPREISNVLGQQDSNIPSSRGLTNFIWAFGQFLDHDLSLTPTQSREEAALHGEFINIDIPTGDPNLDPNGTGNAFIEVRRSEFIEGTGTDANNPRQFNNEITHWIDLSSVYGSDTDRATQLRSFHDGHLQVSAGELLPLAGDIANDNPGPTPDNELFVAGDVRANENVVLSSMHTLFMREHNQIATDLAEIHPDWSDEQLYQRARQINIAQWQNIVYNEYLPTLLGEGVVPTYGGYNDSVDPRISRTFSTAAYRFGHTQLSSEIVRLDAEGNVLPEGNLTLFESFFPSADVVQETGIDPILRGIASSLSQEVDTKLIDDVRNLLFNFGNFTASQDLFALNLQRGRDHGLADYNTVRENFRLRRVTSFADITSNVETQLALEELYGSVDDIDAFAGMLAEDHIPGGSVGETIATVLVEQFDALRAGDRFFYANIFSDEEIALIEDTRLSDIIRRNTDTTIIQDNVFTLFNEGTMEDDILSGGLGDDHINGLGGNDTISGHAGADNLFGRNGDDTITAGTGDDRVLGGNGDDTIGGGAGMDRLSGGNGDDYIEGGDDNDIVRGQGGNDVVLGGDGADQVYGNSGNDVLRGDRGNDDLFGGSGNDVLAGADPTTSSPGLGEVDHLTGGGGSDYFILGTTGNRHYDDIQITPGINDSYAVIKDFNRFTDTIQLTGLVSQYYLQSVTLPGGFAPSTGIYQAGTNDLIGAVEFQSVTSFTNGFAFV